MAYPDIATKFDLANELVDQALAAAASEQLLAHIDAVLAAIYEGGLLDALPADEGDRARHNAAMHLISDIVDKLQEHGKRPGTDLSISLRVLATDVQKGRFSHRQVLEEDVPSLSSAVCQG